MNSDTRIPDAVKASHAEPTRSIWPATSSPPSVVTSSRDSGTRQQS